MSHPRDETERMTSFTGITPHVRILSVIEGIWKGKETLRDDVVSKIIEGSDRRALSWIRVRISYHIFNNLAKLLNGDLAAKIGQGIFSKDLMDRECNCYLPSKVNGKCVYKGKCRSKCIIYQI